MARLKVGVLISGRGSNLQALIDACADPAFPAEIVLVLSNKADAYGLERARKAGIPAAVVSHRDYADKPGFEAAMDDALGRQPRHLAWGCRAAKMLPVISECGWLTPACACSGYTKPPTYSRL